ncbi:MAG: ABC transporter permease [Actinobacteria bacterium]|nr:MAG: ABC transporter permease [Actinomycetota bacterium]
MLKRYLGLFLIAIVVIISFLAPLIIKHNPLSQKFPSFKTPTINHPFGTDELGRDLFSRVVHGVRSSLVNALFAVSLALLAGLIVGMVSGYYGGFVDSVLMRIVDIFLAFPYILGAIVLMVVLKQSSFSVSVAIAAFLWASFARLYRASVLEVKEKDYVKAAIAMGAGDLRIMTRHILPNSVATLIVYATLGVGSAILAEAVLSFVGLGLQHPAPSLGLILSDAVNYLDRAPQMMWFPGFFLIILVLGFIMCGDGLNEYIRS